MDALSLWRGEPLSQNIRRDFATLFQDLNATVAAHCDERITGIQLRKFAAWFSTGYPGAAQFRKNLFQSKNNDEVMSLANEFFAAVGCGDQADTSEEAFLMGGHG